MSSRARVQKLPTFNESRRMERGGRRNEIPQNVQDRRWISLGFMRNSRRRERYASSG